MGLNVQINNLKGQIRLQNSSVKGDAYPFGAKLRERSPGHGRLMSGPEEFQSLKRSEVNANKMSILDSES
jgi:hypothetical protein